MKKVYSILLILLSVNLTGCADDDSDDVQEFTVYSHLGSAEPTVLNRIADLSRSFDLEITVSDRSVATAQFDRDGIGFTITPIKEGKTNLTVKEKNRLKYIINVVVEYEGAGNWHINDFKITVQCDAGIKEAIEQDVQKQSLFYNQNENARYSYFYYETNKEIKLGGNTSAFAKKYFVYKFLEETQSYEFTEKSGEKKYLYTFTLKTKSDVGIIPQHKVGIYATDRTKEYQEKYPDKNIYKVIEEQEVECYYNL